MSWTVEYDDALKIFVDTYIGVCGGQDFQSVAKRRIELSKEVSTTRTLVDASKLIIESPSTLDIYKVADEIYEREENRMDWRLAITTPESPTAQEPVKFFVNVCVNRGWNVREFAHRKDAIEWLLSK